VIAGVNLRPFVIDWLADLNSGGGIMRGLLKAGPRYGYGGHMMMANIGPSAEPDDANDEVTLFFRHCTSTLDVPDQKGRASSGNMG
jgi:hypothetical protein